MTDAWLDSAERLPSDHSEGGSYVADVPWRWVGHTVEGQPSTLAGARATASAHPTPPHLWAWWEKDWLGQTVRLDRSAFALKHPAGTPETNKMGAIQVEVFGFAKDSPARPPEFWRWLGTRVVRPLIDAGYAFDLTLVAPTTGTDGAGTSGAVRMSRAAWRTFNGLCVHANVPDNEHWDMGQARLDLIAKAASAAGGGGDMPLDAADKQWLRDLMEIATGPRVLVGSGQRSELWTWVQAQRDDEVKLLAAIEALPQKVVAALPPAGPGGLTPAQVEAACRAAVVAELGFLKPGQ